MRTRRWKRTLLFFIGLFFLGNANLSIASGQQTMRHFTVADDIGLARFGGSWTGMEKEVQVSPDGNYFAAETERGRQDLNKVEDSFSFYRSQDIEHLLEHSDRSQAPLPVWVVRRCTDKQGPIINDWRWLPDSSGLAYLERMPGGNYRLVLANLRTKTIEPLTGTTEAVSAFDIRDRRHYVYTRADPAEREKLEAERKAPAVVATGRALFELLFPDDSERARTYDLWVVAGDRHFQVKQDGLSVVPDGRLALSPKGNSVVAILPVREVPPSWETLYPPPFALDPHRIRAGNRGSVRQYVRIDLQTGSVQSLTEAPLSYGAGSWAAAVAGPSWSKDGQAVLLPGTFLKSRDNIPTRPCIAVVDLPSNTRTCVEILKGKTESGLEEGAHTIFYAEFAGGDKKRVTLGFIDHSLDESLSTTEYVRSADDRWHVARQFKGAPEAEHSSFKVIVKQSFNDPPRLVAVGKHISRVIWDPNPQLKDIDLGHARIYTWKDGEGRDWKGGLFTPSNYNSGGRYPLVIQTHGFYESEFVPSGIYPTAFAARALAAAGIIVLQVSEATCPVSTPNEGPCAVSIYEAAVKQLVSEGIVNPDKIGIVGFSRTGFYVMEMLTTGSIHIKAASVTDSTLADYFQYMTTVDYGGNYIATDYDSVLGAKPFGVGIQEWLKRSPGFNLDKVSAPLVVVGEGPRSLLFMWGLYAGLRHLHKPVELVMLNDPEHVLTNPAARMASQGGSVDWFRFWLQDYEDPSPAKSEQYARWRELRKSQEEQDK